MPSPPSFNIDELLAPCTTGGPTGPDLRLDTSADAIYQQLRNARDRSRDVEIQVQKATEGYALEQCQWNKVLELGLRAIRQHSKDYQIAAWICESAVRLHGFAGLRDAFQLARRMGKEFWNGIYPFPEQEEGVEPPTELEKVQTRVQPFEGLLAGALNMPLSQIPVTEIEGYTFLDYRQAKDLEKIADKAARQMKIDAGAVALSDIEAAINSSNAGFYQNLFEDITQALAELDQFSKFLDEHCGKDEKGFSIAPATSETQKAIQAGLETVKELGKRKGLFADAPPAEQGGGAVQTVGAPEQNGRRSFTRDDALAQLLVLAEFFRRSEPHSPVSHHVEEAVRWGRMGLPELLGELIADDKTRQQVLQRVGITDVPEAKKK